MGAGDEIPSVLRSLGMNISLISTQELVAGGEGREDVEPPAGGAIERIRPFQVPSHPESQILPVLVRKQNGVPIRPGSDVSPR